MAQITYIANIRFPTEKAHGRQIVRMCEAFAREGQEVHLLVPRRKTPISEDPFEYYKAERVFKVTMLPTIDAVRFGKIGFYLQYASFLLSVWIFTLLHRCGIVYTRDRFTALLFKNAVIEIHALPGHAVFLDRLALRRARTLIVLTSYIKERLLREGIEKRKINVCPDAVDIAQFDIPIGQEAAREKLSLPRRAVLLGYVGMLKTMDQEKGIDLILEALRGLPETTRFVVVGGSKEDIRYYRELAERARVDQKTIFAGFVRHEQIPLYLKAFDLVLAPFPNTTHYAYYMSPIKIFEYMAARKPMIVSDLPSLRDILDENSAFFIEPENASSLVAAIRYATEHRREAEEKARNAYHIVRRHTWEQRAKTVLTAITSR